MLSVGRWRWWVSYRSMENYLIGSLRNEEVSGLMGPDELYSVGDVMIMRFINTYVLTAELYLYCV
jgi:hypothetical protein